MFVRIYSTLYVGVVFTEMHLNTVNSGVICYEKIWSLRIYLINIGTMSLANVTYSIHRAVQHMQGVPKTGLFLRVNNFVTVNGRRACDMSKVS